MQEAIHVGVMGAGSIGCFVGGKLLVADAARVTFVGRARLGDEIAAHGMTLRDVGQPELHVPFEQIRWATDAGALATCDVVLCCVKSLQTEAVAQELAAVLAHGVLVVSLQNGIQNAAMLRRAMPEQEVCPGIVDFNVVTQEGGVFHCGLSGPLKLEERSSEVFAGLCQALSDAGFQVERHRDLAPAQWTKLLVNLNNAVSALTGAPSRDILLTKALRRIVAALAKEALAVLKAAGIRPASLRGAPAGLLPWVLGLPDFLVKLLIGAQLKIDPEARSSMWEDLQRGRLTEVDFLNGEIVRLAEASGCDAPLNRKIIALIHEAEDADEGSPGFTADVLWQRLTG